MYSNFLMDDNNILKKTIALDVQLKIVTKRFSGKGQGSRCQSINRM